MAVALRLPVPLPLHLPLQHRPPSRPAPLQAAAASCRPRWQLLGLQELLLGLLHLLHLLLRLQLHWALPSGEAVGCQQQKCALSQHQGKLFV